MSVKAAQHVYGNVEKDISPRGVGGFQTLFHTKSALSADNVAEIEGRTVYHSSDNPATKLLFFTLENGEKAVVSRVLPQQSLDRFGRRGGYLAHSFIFSREDFALLGSNPFAALDLLAGKFTDSAETALNLQGRMDDDIPAISLEISEQKLEQFEKQCIDHAAEWNDDELRKLARAALTAGEAQKERRSMAVVGEAAHVEDLLKAAFALTPRNLRGSCTFDTYAHGSNPVAAHFWARGYQSQSDAPPQFKSANADQKSLRESPPQPEGPFEKWLFAGISNKNLTFISSSKDIALEIQGLLTDGPYDKFLVSSAPNELLNDFLELNWELAAEKLKAKLTSSFGAALAATLTPWAESQFSHSDVRTFLSFLTDGFDASEVAERLYETFRDKVPSQDELAALEKIASSANHQTLKIITLAHKRDVQSVRRELEYLGDEDGDKDYLSIVNLMMEVHGLNAASILPQSRTRTRPVVETFARLSTSNERMRDQTSQLIKVLLDNEQLECLDALAPLVSELRTRDVKNLAKTIDKRRDETPQPFLDAIDEILEAESQNSENKPKGGVFRGLFRRFSGSPKQEPPEDDNEG